MSAWDLVSDAMGRKRGAIDPGVPGVSCEYLTDRRMWRLTAGAGPDILSMNVSDREATDNPQALYRAALDLRREAESIQAERLEYERRRYIEAQYRRPQVYVLSTTTVAPDYMRSYATEILSATMRAVGIKDPDLYITQDELAASRSRALDEIVRARSPQQLQAQLPPPEDKPEPKPDPRREFPELELGDAEVAAPVLVAPKLDID